MPFYDGPIEILGFCAGVPCGSLARVRCAWCRKSASRASRTHKPRRRDCASIDRIADGGPPASLGVAGVRRDDNEFATYRGKRRMKSNQKLSRTIAAILSASAAHAVLAADPPQATADPPQATAAATSTTAATSSGTLQEVIVTAQRRAQNIQDVPISIQAMTGKTLESL